MAIVIEGLAKTAYNAMITDCGEKIFYESDLDVDCYDVNVSPNAIVKINGNTVYFDLGGRKTSIERNEFFSITIS